MKKFGSSITDQFKIQELILKHYSETLTLSQLHKKICEEHYVYIRNVSQRVKSLSLKLKEGRGSVSKLSENPFKIGTVNNEYWLGFFLADGHLGKTSREGIFLHNTELEFLRTFYIHCKTILGEHIRYHDKWKPFLSIFFGHKETWYYLKSLGISSDKRYGFNLSFQITWPMLRGIFDGDGSVRIRGNSIEWKITTGSPELKEEIVRFLFQNGFESRVSPKGKAFDIVLKGTKLEKTRFLNSLYQEGEYHLPYKLNKISAYISKDILENRIKCWESLRDQLTTTYSEMKSVNVKNN